MTNGGMDEGTGTPRQVTYAPIVRQFRAVDESPVEAATRSLLHELEGKDRKTWDNLFSFESGTSPSIVVLQAPSGSGKSTEARQAANRQRTVGHAAFYATAGRVAAEGFTGALDRDDRDAYEDWRDTPVVGVLYLDAADEVVLHGRRFEDTCGKLDAAIDFALGRLHVVVTARNGTWSSSHDAAITELIERGTDRAKIEMLTFAPLGLGAVGELACVHGVTDPNAFVNAFVDDGLDAMLDLRPPDVESLAAYWNAHGRFDAWSDVLAHVVAQACDERNPLFADGQRLSRERATLGLRRAAAACILAKKSHMAPSGIVLSDTSGLEGGKLFSNFPGSEAKQLFANALFVHKGERAVQLPQGALSSFLAAEWVAARSSGGWSNNELLEGLFPAVPWIDERRLPGSRRRLAGWIASAIPELRSFIIELAPEILLYEGDPSKLADDDIVGALTTLFNKMRDQGFRSPWPTRPTLRLLARPTLEKAIVQMLEEYADCEAVEYELLLLAEVGCYRSARKRVLELALAADADDHLRAAAASAMSAISEPSDLATLLDLATTSLPHLRGEILRVLVPRQLGGEALAQFLGSGGDHRFQFFLKRVVGQLTTADLDLALDVLRPDLAGVQVDELTEGRLAVANILMVSRLCRSGDAELPPWFGELLAGLEALLDGVYTPEKDVRSLDLALRHHERARRALWTVRIAAPVDSDADTRLTMPRIGEATPGDIDWLLEQQRSVGDDRKQTAISTAIHQVLSRANNIEQAAVREAGGAAAERLEQVLKSADGFREAKARHAEEEEAKARATLENNITQLEPKRSEIASGEDLRSLVWGWQHTKTSTERGRADLAKLTGLVGDDLADVFRFGFKALWRRHEPPLPEPGSNSTSGQILAGLTGVMLDIQDDDDLTRFSIEEARLAARYALYELNSFPVWFADLLGVHPEPVVAVLRGVLESEWDAECEHHGVLRFVGYAHPTVAAAMRTIVCELLNNRAPSHPRTVRHAGDALISSGASVDAFAERVRGYMSGASDAAMAEWVRIFAHVAPTDAAAALDAVHPDDEDKRAEFVLRVAELLDNDFDKRGLSPQSLLMDDVSALERWALLLFDVVRPADDKSVGGLFTTRHHAQDLRDRCLSRLGGIPSQGAHAALCRVRAAPVMSGHLDKVDYVLSAQLDAATEAAATPWTEVQVLEVERGDERTPSTDIELFRLARRHLDRLRNLIENDDFSYRGLIREDDPEERIQLWAASNLKLISRGLYSVVREQEVQDKNEVDIAALAGPHRVPIEIKPVGTYSYTALMSCIEDQLFRKYMRPREVNYGILLLVLQKRRTKGWHIGGSFVGFGGLVAALRAHAQRFGGEMEVVIDVVGIDVTVTTPPQEPTTESVAQAPPSSRHVDTKEHELEQEATRQLDAAGFFVQQQARVQTVGRRTACIDLVAWSGGPEGKLAPDLIVEVTLPIAEGHLLPAARQLSFYLPLINAPRAYIFDGSWHLVSDDFESTTSTDCPRPEAPALSAQAPVELIERLLWKSFDSMRPSRTPDEAWQLTMDALTTADSDAQDVDPQLLQLAAAKQNGPGLATAMVEAARRISGHKGGFGGLATPPHLATALTQLLAPQPGWTIADPFCGSGTLLRAAHAATDGRCKLIGGEINEHVAEYSRRLLRLGGVEATIQTGDSLKEMPAIGVDGIITNPPMGLRLPTRTPLTLGGATREGTVVVVDKLVASLRDGGRAVVLVQPSLLYSSAADEFRRILCTTIRLVAVIELPPDLLTATAIRCVAIVIEKGAPSDTLVARLEDDWEHQLADEGDFMEAYLRHLESAG